MFPDNLYISDPTEGLLYTVENDVVAGNLSINPNDSEVNQGHGILVSQNMVDVYTVNRNTNTITRIRNGQVIGDIPVGRSPYGICEDRNGRIYVTNNGDDTITMIENGQVVGYPISVNGSPRGIVADYFGNIWVSCFMTNTVAKIVNNVVVDEIPVAYNPDGITCSPTNEIWVACSGSDVVVKIADGKKKLTLPTGKHPIAVVTDKKGHVFVANFEEDTVTMISTSDDNLTTTIPVGDGPNAIDINSKGHVYVTSSLSTNKVYKIDPVTQQTSTIDVCKSQSAYGDFTGCATYNVFFPYGKGEGAITDLAVEHVIQALKPTFKLSDVSEEANFKFKVDSDLFNLSLFSGLTLNGQTPDENGFFEIPSGEINNIQELQLVGRFGDNESEIITFNPVKFKSTFKVFIGTTNSNYQNATAKAKVVDFSNKDVVTYFMTQLAEGHLFLLVPTRVFNTFKNGFMVQGGHDIGNSWAQAIPETSVPDTEDPTTTVTKTGEELLAALYEELGWSAAQQERYTLLVNTYTTSANESWIFSFFNTDN